MIDTTVIRKPYYFCIECGSDKIENRDLGLCSSCNKSRRDKENAKPKVVKQVKKVSDKRAEELKEYPKMRNQFLEFKTICELNFEGCSKKSTEIHHCSKDSRNFLNTKTWKAGCSNCHHYLEVYVSAEQRREMGLLTD